MDWTATITDVKDNLPDSDILNVAVTFSNGTDSFNKTYALHANDYTHTDGVTTFLAGELDKFVAIKDFANQLKGRAADDAVATATATVGEVKLNPKQVTAQAS